MLKEHVDKFFKDDGGNDYYLKPKSDGTDYYPLGIRPATTNYILTQMGTGASYTDALAEAQRLGYAEADPTLDVGGFDARSKLRILMRLKAWPLPGFTNSFSTIVYGSPSNKSLSPGLN